LVISMTCRLLLVSGSLRAKSTNTAVLRTAAQLVPPGVEAILYPGLANLPSFNPDDEVLLPPAVADLRSEIHSAAALIFSTPEYAGALPGSFKNLLDWTIGDDQPGSIYNKPVAWINASPRGAEGAHRELRQVLGYAHASILEAATVSVPVTEAMIGADGLVIDPAARVAIAHAVEAIAAARVRRRAAAAPPAHDRVVNAR
jgi:NAD(P)H-dependent FMN reductase